MAIRDNDAAYHLVPSDVWQSAGDASFRAASLDNEGFIHLTHTRDDLVDVANRYYAVDARPFVALFVYLPALTAAWRYDGDARYPHVYGPIDRAAIVGVEPMLRATDGTFLSLGVDDG